MCHDYTRNFYSNAYVLCFIAALENRQHYEAYEKALKEGKKIPLKYLKLLFFGPPRTGKTSMRRRLVGEIQNLENEPVQPSTCTAEVHDVIVKVFKDKITNLQAVLKEHEWLSVKTLFGKESSHGTELDEELQLLYQFIYGLSPKEVTSSDSPTENTPLNENRSPIHPLKIRSTPIANTSSLDIKEDQAQSNKMNLAKTKADVPSHASPEINVSISTLTASPVTEPRYGLSTKQAEEIEKAFKAFEKVLHTPGKEQLDVLLNRTMLMNMVDTGGQPAFLEMLPALTMGPALYLIFFRLNQELKMRYKIKYVSEDSEEVELHTSSYTVEEVIFQALSSIACFSCTTPKKANVPNPSHAAVLIGTHKDQLGSDPENKIKAKDDALKENLKDVLDTDIFESEKNFLHYASDDQLMFTIDNMKGDDIELKKIRERLLEVIDQMFNDKFFIPASWLMFSIFLRKMRKRTMSVLQCREIGNRLEVENTEAALWFLHHHVGILLHFPEVEEIKDIVICDPQVVFECYRFDFEQLPA